MDLEESKKMALIKYDKIVDEINIKEYKDPYFLPLKKDTLDKI